MNGHGLARMYCRGIGLVLEQAQVADRYSEALGVDEEGLGSGVCGDMYGEKISGLESADEGDGGELNLIGDGDADLRSGVDGVDETFDEALLGLIAGLV